MNKEDYVSLEVAKMLKEKGFNEECEYYISENTSQVFYKGRLKPFKEVEHIVFKCPTLYEAQKWIWQSNKSLVTAFIKAPFGQPHEFIYCIQDAKNTIDDYGTIVSEEAFSSYEEALNTGILEALKLI